MDYLVLLLLILGITVFMLGAFLALSYGLGALLNARRTGASEDDPGARFEADRDWYENLPMWQRNVAIVWWLANRYLSNTHARRGVHGDGAASGYW
jgi:hypothetical protein